MNIKIVPKPLSISEKKTIILNGEKKYSSETSSIAGQNCIKLIDIESGLVKSIIINDSSFLKSSFIIRFLNEENIPIKLNSSGIFNNYYEGFYNENKYNIQYLLGVFSILKNDIKIGNSISYEDAYEILDYTDLELIISLCLIINHIKRNDED